MSPAPTIAHASSKDGVAPWEKTTRLNWLQTLRAVSVLLVMLHHLRSAAGVYFNQAGLVDFFYFGHCGVDVFFVISGFIMWHVYRDDLHRPERFPSFIQRRFIRIYPIYWILTTALLVVIAFAPGEVKSYKRNIFYIIESYSLLPLGYAQGNPIIPAAWSLFHEIKFYLVFSLCILLPPRWARWWVRGWVALTLLHMAWLVTPEGQQAGMGFLFSPFNLQFLSGCVIAHLVGTRRPSLPLGLSATLLGVASIAFFGCLDAHLALEDRLIRALAYGLPAALLVFAATTFDYLPSVSRHASRFMAFVGDASYAIYLIHYPIYGFCSMALIKLGWAAHLPLAVILSLLFLGAFAVSLLFHITVEKPLTAKLKRWLR